MKPLSKLPITMLEYLILWTRILMILLTTVKLQKFMNNSIGLISHMIPLIKWPITSLKLMVVKQKKDQTLLNLDHIWITCGVSKPKSKDKLALKDLNIIMKYLVKFLNIQMPMKINSFYNLNQKKECMFCQDKKFQKILLKELMKLMVKKIN